MQVKGIIPVMAKLQAILEYYQEYTVEEMLDDIYNRCCVKEGNGQVPVVQSATKLPAENALIAEKVSAVAFPEVLLNIEKKQLPPLEQLIEIIAEIPADILPTILERYKNKELYSMVKMLGLKGNSKSNKPQLVSALTEWAQMPLPAVNKGIPVSNQVLPVGRTSQPDKVGKSGGDLRSLNEPKMPGKKLTPPEAARLIPEIEKEKAMVLLDDFTRAELLEIAAILGLSVPRTAVKHNMILMIVNHFSYIKLHQQMSHRRK